MTNQAVAVIQRGVYGNIVISAEALSEKSVEIHLCSVPFAVCSIVEFKLIYVPLKELILLKTVMF